MPSVLPQKFNRRNSTNIKRVGFRVPQDNPPEGAVIGDVWYETDTDILWSYDGTNWNPLTSPAFLSVNGTGGTTSGTAVLTTGTINIPAFPYASRVQISAAIFITKTVATDDFHLITTANAFAALVSIARFPNVGTGGSIVITKTFNVAVSTAVTLQMGLQRAGGSGTATCFTDGRSHFLEALIYPQV